MSSNRPRALVGARVSVLSGPQKVSHEAQIDTATKWATAHDYPVVGSFEDLGVSASVPPDERPELGPWIRERSHEWQELFGRNSIAGSDRCGTVRTSSSGRSRTARSLSSPKTG
ncbi:recombinase family protein [Mycobacteroides abscessus]|uniref:recombinase family protein n=1 Tax=Mycobacteroides abscessus TaxID=36809 RepID=UPI0009A5DBAE|nr:recombinase family protein [Mycobacteroides abscessus]